jgi:hypothetical protein
MGDNNVTLDKRDLFDAVRSAIKDAMLEQGSREDGVELFEDATDRTNKCLSELYASLPDGFTVGQVLKCVAIPDRHDGYFTIGREYIVVSVDLDDDELPLKMTCDTAITLWCEAEAFVAS